MLNGRGVPSEREIVCVQVDAATKLETQAYCRWIAGSAAFENRDWKSAAESFNKAVTIYTRLASIVKSSALQTQYTHRCTEMQPQLRYCAYELGDENVTLAGTFLFMRLL